MKAELFYADDEMVASTDSGWLQSAFDMLTGIFDRVCLRTNIRKTVGMVCRPFWEAVVQADDAYTRRMTVEGRISKERQRERLIYPEFGKDTAKGSLVTYRQTHHDVAKGGLVSERGEADGSDGGDDPRTYRMAFPVWEGPRPCPVEGCSGRASTQTTMRVHLWHRHVRDRGDPGGGQPPPPTVPPV